MPAGPSTAADGVAPSKPLTARNADAEERGRFSWRPLQPRRPISSNSPCGEAGRSRSPTSLCKHLQVTCPEPASSFVVRVKEKHQQKNNMKTTNLGTVLLLAASLWVSADQPDKS